MFGLRIICEGGRRWNMGQYNHGRSLYPHGWCHVKHWAARPLRFRHVEPLGKRAEACNL